MDEMFKVYALTDGGGRITAIDGGCTTPADLTGWVLIDEGYGDKYNLCQNNYLPTPLRDDRGLFRWKLVDGRPVERSQEEIDADWVEPAEKMTLDDLVEIAGDHEYRICLMELGVNLDDL